MFKRLKNVKNEITEVFKSLDDLFNELDKVVTQNKITLISADIKEVVSEIIIKILNT
jgi:hypothetical protein